MRPARKLLVHAAVLLLAITARGEDDVSGQLRTMNDRLERLESELQATHDQLDEANRRADAQQELIDRADLEYAKESESGLSAFFEETRVEGWVATSYWWNVNRPSNGTNLQPGPLAPFGVNNGRLNTTMPFRPDHNSFQVDQVWFGLSKPANVESRAGFGVDVVFGKTADVLNANPGLAAVGIGPGITTTTSNGSVPHLFQAYLEYLAPTPWVDVRFTAGLFESEIGAEKVQIPQNYNASRGLMFQIIQPQQHLGAKAEIQIGPVDLMVGIANDARAALNVDFDGDKAVLWGIGIQASETIDIDVNGVWGGDSLPGTPANNTRSADYLGIVDLVVRWDPSDVLSAWLNIDYSWSRNDGISPSPDVLGVGAAARYMVSANTGISVRGEYLFSSENFIDPLRTIILFNEDQDLWSLTATLDHSFTEHLMLRAEARYDRISSTGFPDNVFFVTSRSNRLLFPRFSGQQLVIGAEAIYTF